MFNMIFETAPIDYLMPDETPITLFPGLDYNPYLTTPPRIYGESVSSVMGLYVIEVATPNGPTTIRMMGATDMTHWPSWEFKSWEWDGKTGEFLGQVIPDSGVGGAFNSAEFSQARDGSIWQGEVLLGPDLIERDPISLAATGVELDNVLYGLTAIRSAMVDRSQNVLLCQADTGTQIEVYNLTTGALIRAISVGGTPRQIVAEDSTRCYVLCTNGILNLVNYVDGVVISTLLSPTDTSVMAYDKFYRRLLFWHEVADDTDGAALSTIRGYYPVPKSVGLMNPIPLRSPRKNRTIPVLTKVYGDVGEPLSGVNIVATPSANATLSGPPGISDTHGEAIINVTCLDDNPITLDIEAEVT